MKVCVYGAGAIGAYLGVALVDAGCDVAFVARGPHLAALQKNGLTLEIGGTLLDVELPLVEVRLVDGGAIGGQPKPRAKA